MIEGAQVDLADLLSRAERRVSRRMAAVLGAAGSSVPQYRVLSGLADGAGHPMSEVAQLAMLPAPTATKLVDRMVADGLVYRRGDETDRRRVLVFLAPRGRQAHERLRHLVGREHADLAGGSDGPGSEELIRLLTRLAGNAG